MTPADRDDDGKTPQKLAALSLGVSLTMLGLLLASWWLTNSLLALSQAADSFADLLTGAAMIWAARVAAQPADAGHPHGHHAAEPIAAVLVAVLAGVLAVEVFRSAVDALWLGHGVVLAWSLLGVLALKTLLKVGVLILSRRASARMRSPVVEALLIDARNDVMVGSLAVLGFFAARYGQPTLDAWLAIPASFWVAWGGWSLARENIDLLMGVAVSQGTHSRLAQLVQSVPGVRSHHALVARHLGPDLEVSVHVVLDDSLSLRAAHDIGVAVERALLDQEAVARAVVHLDVEYDHPAAEPLA